MRSGISGPKAARSSLIVRTSSSGGSTPALSLSDLKPKCFTIACACSTSVSALSASRCQLGRPARRGRRIDF